MKELTEEERVLYNSLSDEGKILYRLFDKRFENIDKRFENIDKRFENIDNRFKEIDNRFKEIDNRFKEIDKRFDDLSRDIRERDSNLRAQFYRLEAEMYRSLSWGGRPRYESPFSNAWEVVPHSKGNSATDPDYELFSDKEYGIK